MTESAWTDRHGYPVFSPPAYASMLAALRRGGYAPLSVDGFRNDDGRKGVFLRHDIDFHLEGIVSLAEIEAEAGWHGTYYVSCTQTYNPSSRRACAILRRIVELGCEIGLHYDLTLYPDEPDPAAKRLLDEAQRISDAAGAPVRSITMHQPHLGHPDFLRDNDIFVNPHDSRLQYDSWYISDSCRAWRDARLLACFAGQGCRRLHLNTHPELWLGDPHATRLAHLQLSISRLACAEIRDYFDNEVPRIWTTHPGVATHDLRG